MKNVNWDVTCIRKSLEKVEDRVIELGSEAPELSKAIDVGGGLGQQGHRRINSSSSKIRLFEFDDVPVGNDCASAWCEHRGRDGHRQKREKDLEAHVEESSGRRAEKWTKRDRF